MLTTLKKRRQFLNAKNLGKSWASECFILQGVSHFSQSGSKPRKSFSPNKLPDSLFSKTTCLSKGADAASSSSKVSLAQPSSENALSHSEGEVEAEVQLPSIMSTPLSPSHIGYVATKKLGNAVVRNRAKRRLREACRHSLPAFRLEGMDYVLIAREKIINAPFEQLLRDLQWALKHLHRILDESSAASSKQA